MDTAAKAQAWSRPNPLKSSFEPCLAAMRPSPGRNAVRLLEVTSLVVV